MHKGGAFVLDVDLPSGINTDTGEVADCAAHAD
ncbi:NAD(P)H-hydrate epimerase, partial [Faecalibacterium prausnitzii]|nr:NAD(P)H-hydrate epimerase [Faecalibacterium prausnitzii]